MFVACNKRDVIMSISSHTFDMNNDYLLHEIPDIEKDKWHQLVGTKLNTCKKEIKDLRIAFICNWNDSCGISTYSKFLVDALLPKVNALHVFSEKHEHEIKEPHVSYCWERGKSMKDAMDTILAWKPDYIVIQHEFGLFPKATYFLQMLQAIEHIPYAVTMHSVYEHLDKTVCSSAIKHIIVHSQEAKNLLVKMGHNSQISVIPHGCIPIQEGQELWNIFQTPYSIVQFGFGFFYKGVDKVLDAIHYLKETDKKFQDIFYCYLCSNNPHTNVVHSQYYDFLMNKINDLKLHDNAVIVRKYQTEQTINNYLRTAKLALFPYVGDPKNIVYGASGAIRVAMANEIPVIASDCHQFDDLQGVVPRPSNYIELAKEIDEVFSNTSYKNKLLNQSKEYIQENSWDIIADKYLSTLQS